MSEPEPSRLHMPTNMGMGGTLPPLSLPPLSLPPIKTDHLGLSPLGMPYSAYPQSYHSPNIASPSNHLSSPQTPVMMAQPPGSPMAYVNGGPRLMPNSLKRRINPADRYPQQFQHPMMLPERPMENQQFAEPPMKQMKGIPGSPNMHSGPPTPSSIQMRFNMDNSPGSMNSMNQSPLPMANQQSTSQMPNGNGYPPVFHHLSPHPMQHGHVPLMRSNQPQQLPMHYPPPSMPQQSMTNNNNHRDMAGPSNGSLLSPMPGTSTSNLYHRPRMGYPENPPQSPYLQKTLMNSPYKSDGIPSTMSPVLPVPYPQPQNLQQMYPRSPMAPPGYPPIQSAPAFAPHQQATSSSFPPPQTPPPQEQRPPAMDQKPLTVPKIEPPIITQPRMEPTPSELTEKTVPEPQEVQCLPTQPIQPQRQEQVWIHPKAEPPPSPDKQQPPKQVEQAPVAEPSAPLVTERAAQPPPEQPPTHQAPEAAPQPIEPPAKQPAPPQKPKPTDETVKALLERRIQGSSEVRNNGQPAHRPPPVQKPGEQRNDRQMELQRRLQEPPRSIGQSVKLAAPLAGANGLPPNAIQQRLQQAGLIPGPMRPPSGQGQPLPVAVRPLPPGAHPQQVMVHLGPKGLPVPIKMEQQQLSQGQLRQMIAERMKSSVAPPNVPKGLPPRLLHHSQVGSHQASYTVGHQLLPGQLHPSQANMPVRSVLQAHQQLGGRSAIGPVIVNPHGHPGLAGIVVAPQRRDPTVSLQLAKLIDERMPQPTMSSKEQYRIYKRKFKYLVFENECYQEELRNLQRKLLKLTRDKNFLLDRLLTYEKVSDTSDEESDSSQKTVDEVPKTKKRVRPNRPKKETQPSVPVARSPSGTPQDSPCPSPAPTTLLAQMLQPSTSSARMPMELAYPRPAVEEKPSVKPQIEQRPAADTEPTPPNKTAEEDKNRIKLASFPPEMFLPGPSSNPTMDVAALMRAGPLEIRKPIQPSDSNMNGHAFNNPNYHYSPFAGPSQQSPPNNSPLPSPTHLNGLPAPDHDIVVPSSEKMDTSPS